MKRNKLEAKKYWFTEEKAGVVTYHLFVHLVDNDKVFCKKFRIAASGSASTIATNKKLKEYDIIEEIKRLFNVRKVELL